MHGRRGTDRDENIYLDRDDENGARYKIVTVLRLLLSIARSSHAVTSYSHKLLYESYTENVFGLVTPSGDSLFYGYSCANRI